MRRLKSVSRQASLTLQNDAGFILLPCVPRIQQWPRTPCRMVSGRVQKVRRFSRSKVGWVESCLTEATDARRGFFRVKRDWDWVGILNQRATAFSTATVGCFRTCLRRVAEASYSMSQWNDRPFPLGCGRARHAAGLCTRYFLEGSALDYCNIVWASACGPAPASVTAATAASVFSGVVFLRAIGFITLFSWVHLGYTLSRPLFHRTLWAVVIILNP
jgi:hypothetical protein